MLWGSRGFINNFAEYLTGAQKDQPLVIPGLESLCAP